MTHSHSPVSGSASVSKYNANRGSRTILRDIGVLIQKWPKSLVILCRILVALRFLDVYCVIGRQPYPQFQTSLSGSLDVSAQVSMIRRLWEYHRRLWLAKPQKWARGDDQCFKPQGKSTDFIPGQVWMARPVKTGGTQPPLPQTAWHLQSRQVFSFCLPWCARHHGTTHIFGAPRSPRSCVFHPVIQRGSHSNGDYSEGQPNSLSFKFRYQPRWCV